MWPIVREALARASPELRTLFRRVWISWLVLVALQIWDSRDARGAAGVAEFLSAILGVTGIALVGVAYTLQRTMEEVTVRPSRHDTDAVQEVLLALPVLGFAAGGALSAAAALMILRALLGADLPIALAGSLVYGGLVVVAQRTVVRSTHTLFSHATAHAALAAEARSEAAAAQIQALLARMNPHFLFNALNTVASLVRTDPKAAEAAVENLSDVLRRTLERTAGSSGTLRDEIEYLRAYLALEQQRWGDRLRVEWDVAPEAIALPLPPLVLQPLVENALKHGLGARRSGGTIRIGARLDPRRLVLHVEDDGAGFPHRWRDGTGLGNLRERLRTLYQGDAAVSVDERPRGARVTVSLPVAHT